MQHTSSSATTAEVIYVCRRVFGALGEGTRRVLSAVLESLVVCVPADEGVGTTFCGLGRRYKESLYPPLTE
jgi:hypothetical protein